ncbi:DNA-directed RNA polymerase III subunit RPC7-like isoform X2 [Ischnura elegans]|uniref:DNA-directed RNA polymerase III subunit RPC7-like isoform X2 n=1 Tax=Ischnura elegans TaxID=197161 RepID=UPI001ED8B4BF|nr:DNA-directed RNA polymerase III subunit RPC7-like isoform X2 [Ischnura elegans]
MGSRGRGGRGGGAGRGRGMSFNVEALGFGVGESLPGPVLTPPLLFPPLPNPPVSLRAEDNRNSSFSGKVDWDYCVMVKKSLVDWLWDVSPFSKIISGPNDCTGKTTSASHVGGVERYSDRYLIPQVPSEKELNCFDWKTLPKELRPGQSGITKVPKRTAGESAKGVKRKKVEEGKVASRKGDLEKRLAELERREGKEDVEEVEAGEEKKKKEGKGEEGGEEEGEGGEDEEELEEEDEEMDDGTDYISSYFDNGEGYLDDDDDGDDGPTY